MRQMQQSTYSPRPTMAIQDKQWQSIEKWLPCRGRRSLFKAKTADVRKSREIQMCNTHGDPEACFWLFILLSTSADCIEHWEQVSSTLFLSRIRVCSSRVVFIAKGSTCRSYERSRKRTCSNNMVSHVSTRLLSPGPCASSVWQIKGRLPTLWILKIFLVCHTREYSDFDHRAQTSPCLRRFTAVPKPTNVFMVSVWHIKKSKGWSTKLFTDVRERKHAVARGGSEIWFSKKMKLCLCWILEIQNPAQVAFLLLVSSTTAHTGPIPKRKALVRSLYRQVPGSAWFWPRDHIQGERVCCSSFGGAEGYMIITTSV